MDEDFVHRAACGCRIIFMARSNYLQSRMESCAGHNTRLRAGLWREALAYQADAAFAEWELAGRPAREKPVETLAV